MIGRLFATTVAVGAAAIVLGIADSTFRHYFRKHAEFEDMKTNTIQEVVVVTEFVDGVEE